MSGTLRIGVITGIFSCNLPVIATIVEAAAASGRSQGRDDRWSESIAVGNRKFLEGISGLLGVTAKDRMIEENAGISFLKEPQSVYWGDLRVENGALRGENSHFLQPL